MGGYKVAMSEPFPLWTSPSEPMDLSCAVGSRDVMTSDLPNSGYPDYRDKELVPLDLSTSTSGSAGGRCDYEATGYYPAASRGGGHQQYDCQYPEPRDNAAYDKIVWPPAAAMKRYDGYTSPPGGSNQCPTRAGACRYDSYPSGVMTEIDSYCRGPGGYNWHEPEHPGQPAYPDQYRNNRYRYNREPYRPYRYNRPVDNRQHMDYYCWRHNGKYDSLPENDSNVPRRAANDCYRPYQDNAYCDVPPAASRPSCMTSGGGFSYTQQTGHMPLPVKQCDNLNQKLNKRADHLRKRLRQKDATNCAQMSTSVHGEDGQSLDSLVVIASNTHWAGGILTSDVTTSGPSPLPRVPETVIHIPLHLLNTSINSEQPQLTENKDNCATVSVEKSESVAKTATQTTADKMLPAKEESGDQYVSADDKNKTDYSCVKVKQENMDS